MKHHSVIALLTDFSSSDSYVAAMKGVILSACATAQIIDISHSVKPQNTDEAAFILWSVYTYFPSGTIFISVVDPGVGSKRNIICVKTNEYIFLAPDNGILKFVLGSASVKSVRAVTNHKLFLNAVSNTFHGRDIIAPVAAKLANGLPLAKLGPAIKPKSGTERFVTVNPNIKKNYAGRIIHIDHFGNIITNLMLTPSSKNLKLQIRIGRQSLNQIVQTYSDTKTKQAFMLTGSTGSLEVSVRNGSAERSLRAKVNQIISLKVG